MILFPMGLLVPLWDFTQSNTFGISSQQCKLPNINKYYDVYASSIDRTSFFKSGTFKRYSIEFGLAIPPNVNTFPNNTFSINITGTTGAFRIYFIHRSTGDHIYNFEGSFNPADLSNPAGATFTVNSDSCSVPNIKTSGTYNAPTDSFTGNVKIVRGLPQDKLVFTFPNISAKASNSTCSTQYTWSFTITNWVLEVPFTCNRDCPAGQELTGTPPNCETMTQPELFSSEEVDVCEDGEVFLPKQTKGLTSNSKFKVSSYSSVNIDQSIAELIQKVNTAKLLKDKYDNLALRISNEQNQSVKDALIQKLGEVNTEKNTAETQRDFLKQEVTSGLISYKNTLRNNVNSITENPFYSVDDPNKPGTLQGYIDKSNELIDYTQNLIAVENTASLINATSIMADEMKLLANFIEDFLNDNNAIEPIKTLALQITQQKVKIEALPDKLELEVNNTVNQILPEYRDAKKEFQKLILAELLDIGALDYDTLEVNSGFSVQSYGFRIKNEGNLPPDFDPDSFWDRVKAEYGTVENFFNTKVIGSMWSEATRLISGVPSETWYSSEYNTEREDLIKATQELAVIVPTDFNDVLTSAVGGKVLKMGGKLGKKGLGVCRT